WGMVGALIAAAVVLTFYGLGAVSTTLAVDITEGMIAGAATGALEQTVAGYTNGQTSEQMLGDVLIETGKSAAVGGLTSAAGGALTRALRGRGAGVAYDASKKWFQQSGKFYAKKVIQVGLRAARTYNQEQRLEVASSGHVRDPIAILIGQLYRAVPLWVATNA